MRFAALDMRHPLLGSHALQQKLYSHYMRAAWPSLVRLLGSSSLLGAPHSSHKPCACMTGCQLTHVLGTAARSSPAGHVTST